MEGRIEKEAKGEEGLKGSNNGRGFGREQEYKRKGKEETTGWKRKEEIRGIWGIGGNRERRKEGRGE